MLETICSKPETEIVKKKLEISRKPGWHDLPRDGGGDIDLADYPSDYQPQQKTLSYDKLP